MLESLDWAPIGLTLKLAGVSTLVLLAIGIPLSLWLSFGASRARPLVQAAVALPLVLPPTVLGFYLLVLLGPRGALGGPWEALGGPRLVFSFPGLVIGSVIYSMPFVVQPLDNAFGAVDRKLLDAAKTLGASRLDRLATVILPLSRPGLLTAATLGFAHTVGEFGVVLMIGGNIRGATQVLSIAIYDHVEAMHYAKAHVLSAIMLAFSFSILLSVYVLNRRFSVVGS